MESQLLQVKLFSDLSKQEIISLELKNKAAQLELELEIAKKELSEIKAEKQKKEIVDQNKVEKEESKQLQSSGRRFDSA